MEWYAFATLLVVVSASPINYDKNSIMSQSNVRHPDGSSSFSYSHAIPLPVMRQESQSLKNVGKDVVAVNKGTSEWVAADGKKYSLSWIADENGYRAEGSHLPTPPPVPAEIAAMLATLPKVSDASHYDSSNHETPISQAGTYDARNHETTKAETQHMKTPAQRKY